MVTKTDSTEIITQPKLVEENQPSFKRWLKHLFYLQASKRYFSQQDQHAIAEAVRQAEQGHIGEIQVVIEGHLPSHVAYTCSTRGRAEQLFAELGVWDTEFNTGVLLYLNMCEQQVEIVVDRGIKQATTQGEWQKICDGLIVKMSNKNYRQAVTDAVAEIGEILNSYYAGQRSDVDNELHNAPIILN